MLAHASAFQFQALHLLPAPPSACTAAQGGLISQPKQQWNSGIVNNSQRRAWQPKRVDMVRFIGFISICRCLCFVLALGFTHSSLCNHALGLTTEA